MRPTSGQQTRSNPLTRCRPLRAVRERIVYPDGALVEMFVWRVPSPVPLTTHSFKYRLASTVDGERIIGYDNERGKGDHRHFRGTETPYELVSISH